MARRSDPAATGTIVALDLCEGEGQQDRDGESAPTGRADRGAEHKAKSAWWRLRTWRKDIEVLARVRAALENLPDADQEASGLPDAADGAAPAEAPVAPAEAPVAPAGPADDPIAAIRRTFASIEAAGDEAVGYFYARLFVRDPALRALFPAAMDEQRDRLFRALIRIVESLRSPEDLASYLGQLGRDHRKYSVEPGMYDAVGAALIATLRAFAGDDFTAAAQEAWTETYAAAAGLMIRAAEEDGATAPAHWPAEVLDVERHADGIAVLTIAPDQPLRYEAGQHLTVQTPRWPHVWRPYSIACRPREDGLLKLHVKAISGGWVSNALVHHTKPGDELVLGPPMGTMNLASAGDRDLLFVAGGTGLSPLKAIAEQAVKESGRHQDRQIWMFYGAKCRDELYDLKDLWRLSDACPRFQLTPVTSDDPAFDGMQGNVGRVAARYMPHKDCETYVSGPVSMVRETLRVLEKAGIERDRIHFDGAVLAARKRVGSGT